MPSDCASWNNCPGCRKQHRAFGELLNVGAFFEEGMWLRYNFQAPGIGARDSGSRSENSPDPQNGAPDLAGEEIRFSFSTTKAPCILLYVSSFTTDFLAALVKPTGSLQIRYHLGGTREPYNIDVDHRSMANGQPHSVNITRRERTITLKLDHYPSVSYHLPSSSDTVFNSPKSLFLGKVIELHVSSIMGRGGEAANLSSKKETKDWGERVDADPHMCFQEQNFSALALTVTRMKRLCVAVASTRSYSLIEILQPAPEFESPYNKGDLLRERRGKGEHPSLSQEPDSQERTHWKNKTSVNSVYQLRPAFSEFSVPSKEVLGPIKTGKIDQEIHKYNTPGFTGCLSRVQFNQIAPLKAALRQTNASAHVHVQGELVESNCGASPLTLSPMSSATDPWHLDHLDSASADFPYNPGQGQAIRNGVNRNSAIIGGVIAVVIFTILCTLVFLIRYMFRHKGTYHTNEAKGAESAESADAAIMNNDPNFTETIDESKKEWLI
ncbi:hypothetical protein MJG53_006720 [Ovis ammon polii x Ovis aries]|uniref:Uncharacterized protein n=1 Tax=Ovis ammon polii x Ovis aries TaxID=2918886 RepID=A0ACB9V6V2_9CETA|nr:hypothetical protein MJG53_006720 [Ovis ammon polii x Ovis aries]